MFDQKNESVKKMSAKKINEFHQFRYCLPCKYNRRVRAVEIKRESRKLLLTWWYMIKSLWCHSRRAENPMIEMVPKRAKNKLKKKKLDPTPVS